MLPFKTRRTSQPQGEVEIDWSNPLTNSLAVAVSPVGSYGMTKLLGPNPITFVGTPAQTVSNKGVGKTGGYMASQAGLNDAPLSIFIRCIITYSAATKGIFSFGDVATEGIPRILIQQNNLSLRIYNVVGEYVFTSGNVITLGKPIDIAYTHNGSSGALYVDGVRIYEDSSTFSSGTNRFANWYVFSGYSGIPSGSMLEHFQWSRALSASEIKSLSANEYQLFKPQSRSLWIPGTVSGGGVATVIPIGQQATGSVGTLVATGAAKALPAGVSASSAVGTPSAKGAAKASPTGVSAAAAVGALSAKGAALGTPLGVSATASVGTPTVIAGANIPATAIPTGVAANAAVGTPVATGAARAAPIGVQASASVGTPVVVAGGAAVAMPSGVQAIGSVGALIATGQAWRMAGGVSASGAVGTPVVLSGSSAIATPAGLQAVGSTGTPVATGACRTYPLGLAGYWSVGTPMAVPGVSGVAVVYPSGVQAGGYVGVPAAKGAAVALAQGVYATGQVGFPVAGLISVIPPGLVKFVPDTASYAFIPGASAYSFEVNT